MSGIIEGSAWRRRYAMFSAWAFARRFPRGVEYSRSTLSSVERSALLVAFSVRRISSTKASRVSSPSW
jgi:hypothetical protein